MNSISIEELRELQSKPRRGNRGAAHHYDADGVWWSSDIEEQYVKGVLKLRERKGEIKNLRRQVRYELHAITGEFVGEYVADAVYDDLIDGQEHVVDIKGDRYMDTGEFKWKARHMRAQYGIEVECIRVKSKSKPKKRRIKV